VKPWWQRIAPYAVPHSRGLLATLLLTLAIVGIDSLKPWPLKLIADNVLTRRPLPHSIAWLSSLPGADTPGGLLVWLACTTVFLFILSWTSRMLRGYLQIGIGARMSYGLGASLFDHLQRLSLRFHGRRPTGDLVQRINTDCGCVRDLIFSVTVPILTSVLSLVAMFVIMCELDWQIAVVASLAAPALGLVIKIFSQPMTARRYDQSVLEGETMGMAEQTLSALPVVQAFGAEPLEDRRFADLTRRSATAFLRTVQAELKFQVSTNAVTAVGTAAVMALGGFHVLENRLSVGGLLVLLSYVSALYAPMETLAWVSVGYASASARARRVLEILDLSQEVRDLPGAKPVRGRFGEEPGHVRLDDVSFSYEPGTPVLKNVSLEARPGEIVALVGATGAGKSTLASLLLRFFDPESGRITLDGVDLRELQLASLRAQIAIVLQDTFLLPITVAENIAYGRPGATRAEIVQAAEAANAANFIRALPQGYETVLGERGATLSGGERQRLGIARALLKNAPILILDEPTSSLDTGTEAQILEALDRLLKGRTTFIIAHRLSTIRRADRIVVLDRGRVVEAGTHRELIEARGSYQRLHELQLGYVANLTDLTTSRK
jgi:ATP-binding cassette subfamily B protein/subfamily B ATP-binding cassette protein MsbA